MHLLIRSSLTMIDVESILYALGFENLRIGDREITALCPMHEQRLGRPDTHASWSINKNTGLHICFSCGWSGGIHTLYGDLGHEVPENLETEMLKASAAKILQKSERLEEDTEPFFLDPQDLVPVPQRMLDVRRLQAASVETYRVRWSKSRRSWAMPLFNPQTGVLMGYQFRQKGSEMNYPTGLVKGSTLFGILEMGESRSVALVESPLDAVRLHGVGVPAVSSFGAWVTKQQIALLSNRFTYVVLALDDDKTGRESAMNVRILLDRAGVPSIPFRYGNSGHKDPGDFVDDDDLRLAWERTIHPSVVR